MTPPVLPRNVNLLTLLGIRPPAQDVTGIDAFPDRSVMERLRRSLAPEDLKRLLQGLPQIQAPAPAPAPLGLPTRVPADASRIAPTPRSALPRSLRPKPLTMGEKQALNADLANLARGDKERIVELLKWLPPVFAASAGERLGHEVAGALKKENAVSPGALAETALAALPIGSAEREFIPSAASAVRDPKTGKIYTGFMHISAVESAPKSVRPRLWRELQKDSENIGFLSNRNRFLNRKQAGRLMGSSSGITTERLRLIERELAQEARGTKPPKPTRLSKETSKAEDPLNGHSTYADFLKSEMGVVGAAQVPFPRRVALPPELHEAAANTPGAKATEHGLSIQLERFQKDYQAGDESVRGGVFYMPKSASSWLKSNFRQGSKSLNGWGVGRGQNPLWYGGNQRVTGEALIERPLLVKGSVGGAVPENAIKHFLGKEEGQTAIDHITAYAQMSPIAYGSGASDATVKSIETVLKEYGGDPSLAGSIAAHSRTGNQLRYALQENIAGKLARDAGYDAILGQGKRRTGKPFITEVFDVRESHYPVPSEPGTLHPSVEEEFQKRIAGAGIVPGRSAPAILAGLAGSIGGGATGATLDTEHPVRGAAFGAIAGGLGGVGVGLAAEARGAAIAEGDRALLGLERRGAGRLSDAEFFRITGQTAEEAAARLAADPTARIPVRSAAELAAENAQREAPLEAYRKKLGIVPNERGAVGYLPEEEGLDREAAVAKMRTLAASGVRAEMRRNPDGTFSVLRKAAAPQSANLPAVQAPKPVKTPKVALNPAGLYGSPSAGSFQSRLLSALGKEQYRKLSNQTKTVQEWHKLLSRDPDIPKKELEETFRVIYGRESEYERAFPVSPGSPKDELTMQELVQQLRYATPVADVNVKTLAAEGGKSITENMIEEEIQYLAEREQERYMENAHDARVAAVGNLNLAQNTLARIWGNEGARRVMDRVKEEFDLDPETALDVLKAGDEFTVNAAEKVFDHALRFDRMKGQLGFPSFRPSDYEAEEQARKYIRKAVLSDEEMLSHVMSVYSEDYDWASLREDAISNLEESGLGEAHPGNTEYASQQRIDEELPYREILVTQGGAYPMHRGTGHFGRDVLSHARAEVDGNTFRVIELQSDVDPSQVGSVVWKPLESRVQLSLGAALFEAAKEGSGVFQWPGGLEATERSRLGKDISRTIYDQIAPKVVRRIFNQLNLPIEDFRVINKADSRGNARPWAHRITLSPEAREKILKMGVPALSIAGLIPLSKLPPQYNMSGSDRQLLGITP